MQMVKGKFYRLGDNCPFLSDPYTGRNIPKALPPLPDNALVLLLETEEVAYRPFNDKEPGYGTINVWCRVLCGELVGWTASKLVEHELD